MGYFFKGLIVFVVVEDFFDDFGFAFEELEIFFGEVVFFEFGFDLVDGGDG